MPIIPETEYDNLYVLTVPNEVPAKLLKMKYGTMTCQPATGE